MKVSVFRTATMLALACFGTSAFARASGSMVPFETPGQTWVPVAASGGGGDSDGVGAACAVQIGAWSLSEGMNRI